MNILSFPISASKLNGFSSGIFVLIMAVSSFSFDLSAIHSGLSELRGLISCGVLSLGELFGTLLEVSSEDDGGKG